ncbi:MAG: riboflavin synthase [Gemmataceae bacterium]
MFTGLVEALGIVRAATSDGAGGKNLDVAVPFAPEVALGESIAVNGCCLSVVEKTADLLRFQAGPETLAKTNLAALAPDDPVNLERSLRLGDRVGGHLVTGHIDAVGTIAQRDVQGDWQVVWFAGPPEIVRQLVPKGSVAIDGVSLTVVDVRPDQFSVMLIPLTLAATTLGSKSTRAPVNLETDIIGKYVAQWMTSYRGPA